MQGKHNSYWGKCLWSLSVFLWSKGRITYITGVLTSSSSTQIQNHSNKTVGWCYICLSFLPRGENLFEQHCYINERYPCTKKCFYYSEKDNIHTALWRKLIFHLDPTFSPSTIHLKRCVYNTHVSKNLLKVFPLYLKVSVLFLTTRNVYLSFTDYCWLDCAECIHNNTPSWLQQAVCRTQAAITISVVNSFPIKVASTSSKSR